MNFDPLGDFDRRGYLRNYFHVKDMDWVGRIEHEAYRDNVDGAFRALTTLSVITYQDIKDTHARLFGKIYPWAGQDRLALAPDLAIGKAGRYDLFAHPRDIQKAADVALSSGNNPVEMRKNVGMTMGYLAYAHPFLDGNGRTILLVHTELARRAGLSVDWSGLGKNEYLRALTQELEKPGRVLDGFLSSRIIQEVEPLSAAIDRLRDHPSLGPKKDEAPGTVIAAYWKKLAEAQVDGSKVAKPGITPRPGRGPKI